MTTPAVISTGSAPQQRPALGRRDWFPQLECEAYLNHGAISPASSEVTAAVLEVTNDFARRGVGAFGHWQQQLQALRGRLAQFIGAADAEDVAFVPNTTTGVTSIALCFPWQPGDVVVLCEGEFPANVTPWQRAAELFELEIRWLPQLAPGDDVQGWLLQVERQLNGHAGPPARLLALSMVQFQTGLKMPLSDVAALCKRHGAQLFVDAIQACGVMPLSVQALGIDYLACGCHKWMMGLPGLGLLYVQPDRIDALRPYTAGWTSHQDAFGFLFEGPGLLRYDRPLRARADVVESGMSNMVAVAAWAAALAALEQLGVEAIFAHVSSYLDGLEQGLLARGFASQRAVQPSLRSGILSVLPPQDIDVIALYKAIDPARVSCSTPDGRLRFSPHWPNALAEVPEVLGVVDQAVRALRG